MELREESSKWFSTCGAESPPWQTESQAWACPDGQGALINTTSCWPRTSAPQGGFQQTSGTIKDLHPERARAEGLHSSSPWLEQHTDLNVSGATFKEIDIRIKNEECEVIHLVVSLMLLHLIFANLIFTHAGLTKIMLQGTASVLLIINNQPKIHGMYSRGLQLGSYITS